MKEILKITEVLTIINEDDRECLKLPKTNRTSEVIDYVINKVIPHGYDKELLEKGIESEVLKTDGRGWRKGKVRLALVFEPDEPESPLDDVRKEIEGNPQSYEENP